MRHFVFSFAAALLALLSPTAQTAEAHWVTAPCTIAGAAELLRCAQLEVPEDCGNHRGANFCCTS
jgi:hypothetical protein